MRRWLLISITVLILCICVGAGDKQYNNNGLSFEYDDNWVVDKDLYNPEPEQHNVMLVNENENSILHVVALIWNENPEEVARVWMNRESDGDMSEIATTTTLVKDEYPAYTLEYEVDRLIVNEHDLCLSWNEPGVTFLTVSAVLKNLFSDTDTEASDQAMMDIANSVAIL